MAYGEPKDVPGKCNAKLSIADNYGDNHTTILCQLPVGHEGSHREQYTSHGSGAVSITWEKHDESYDISALEDALEQAIQTAFPEATRNYDEEWLGSDDDCYFVNAWVLEGRKVNYRVLRKDTVEVDATTQLSESAAIERILSTLRGT